MTGDSTRKRWAEPVHVPVRTPRSPDIPKPPVALHAAFANFLRALRVPAPRRRVAQRPRILPTLAD